MASTHPPANEVFRSLRSSKSPSGLPRDNAALALRVIGSLPTETFISSLPEQIESIEKLINIEVPGLPMTLADALSVFDEGRTGGISFDALAYILLGSGEPLPLEDADEFLQLVRETCSISESVSIESLISLIQPNTL